MLSSVVHTQKTSILLELDEIISPNMGEVIKVSLAQSNLLKTMESKYEKGLLPRPIDFINVGSYARSTKLKPLDDVDIFYVIGRCRIWSPNWYSLVEMHTPIFWDLVTELGNYSSIRMLNEIKKEISKTYSTSEIKRNHEVVNVYLSSYEVGFDLVPAIYIEDTGNYLIPEGKNSEFWKVSNPVLDQEFLRQLDVKHNGLATKSIKLLKYWFRRKKICSPRSYHIESIAYYLLLVCDRPLTNIAEALGYLLRNINYNGCLYACPDPTGLSDNITSDLLAVDVTKIMVESSNAYLRLLDSDIGFVKYLRGE